MTPPENDRAKSVNLARKLRPLGFDGIIGQDFVMRMLQNSLYKDQLFPVYLFFGQHGCGKTSTARVFAAAMNCKNLEAFRKNPREHKVPCHNCSSCTSFKNENYPDFIEIDAASHTGVENVRQIIEASSYVPVAGAKRVYLIDEAHMLSKAAFNALLKLLEEPPKSAVFLLATTEIQKVPNTVRSRCFQAPFSVPDRDVLIAHLEKISAQEDITVSRRALEVLVAHTGGFIRDTINLLDQLNALHLEITEEAIIEALGCVSDKDFLEIGTLLVEQKSNELLVFLEKIRASRFSPQHLWTKSIEFFRILMRAKLLGAKNIFWGTYEKEKILELAQQCSIERINAIVHLLWGQEEIFLRTSKKDIFVEHLMLQICSQVNVEPLAKIIEAIESGGHSKTTRTPPPREEPARSFTPPPPRQQFVPPASTTPAPVEKENSAPAAPLDQTPTNISPIDSSPIQSSAENQLPQEWTKFLAELPPLGDNLVHTGLQKALRLENANGKTTIFFDQLNPFLVSHLEETKKRWLPILQNHIADIKDIDFKGGVTAEQKREEIPQLNATTQRRSTWRPAQGLVDVSDKEKWPKAQILLKHFPGRLTETQ